MKVWKNRVPYLNLPKKHSAEHFCPSVVEHKFSSFPGSRKIFIWTVAHTLMFKFLQTGQNFRLSSSKKILRSFALKQFAKSNKVESDRHVFLLDTSFLMDSRTSISRLVANLMWCTGFGQNWEARPISLPGVKRYTSESHRSPNFFWKKKSRQWFKIIVFRN